MKPSNLLLTTPINEYQYSKTLVKTIDFGLSQKHPASHFSSRFGTITFMAPEVFKYNFSYPADIWAAGICIYLLITGLSPYHIPKHYFGIDDMELIIQNQIINFNHPNWNLYNSNLRFLVKQMLNIIPENRPTAQDILRNLL